MPEGKQELIAVRMPQSNQASAVVQQKQRRQMLIALAILLLALILVLLKDWHSWFPPAPASSDATEPLERSIIPSEKPANGISSTAKASQAMGPKNKASLAIPSATETPAPAIVASDRAVLPPLEVEVVAGGHHRAVQPSSNSVRIDLQSETAEPQVGNNEVSSSAQPARTVVNAAETMHLSSDAAQIISRPVEPNYPMLAKQMKVQGSVVLQALIGRNGNIEDLHVLSGPAILSSAAMQAVKQWRFRPYYLSGEPVETQARITVNFSISTY